MPRRIDVATCPSELSFFFEPQARIGESSLSSATHRCSFAKFKDEKKSFWAGMDALYHSIEGLRALDINLQSEGPWPLSLRNSWVEKVGVSLQRLRTRENFSLTFTIEGDVFPPPQIDMLSPRLPIQLQDQVLRHLVIESNSWRTDDRAQSRILIRCSLVCRHWFNICYRALWRDGAISLRTPRQLAGLVTRLSSLTVPINGLVTELSFISYREFRPLFSIATLYLATKLPSLRCMVIDGGDVPFLYHGHSSLSMHLKHFKTVTELRLFNISFKSFWDFRRCVAALPALSNLGFDRIHLLDSGPFQRSDGRVPSLISMPQNLLSIHAYGLKWNPLWTWVTLIRPCLRNPENEDLHPHPHPYLTLHDAATVWDITASVESHRHDFCDGTFDWSYNEKRQQCKSINSACHRDRCSYL